MRKVKNIYFQGRKLQVENRTTLQRHTEKLPISVRNFLTVQTTAKGARDALAIGEKLPKNLKLRLYHTTAERGRQTAMNIASGHASAGGKISHARGLGKIGKTERATLHEESPIRDYTKVDYAHWEQTVRDWLDGRISAEIMQPPQEFIKNLVRKQLAIGERARKQGIKENELLNISHDLVVIAAFEGLTGEKIKPKSKMWPKVGEGLHLYHVKDGNKNRVILQYKSKRYDVTEKFNGLMKK